MKNLFNIAILIVFIFICLTCGGTPKDNPKDIQKFISEYDRLVVLIQKECKKDELIDENKLSKEIKYLLDTLNIHSISYTSNDSYSYNPSGEGVISLCGNGNIFTGDSCYMYNCGQKELEIRNNINSGCERQKLFGKWYKAFIYFD